MKKILLLFVFSLIVECIVAQEMSGFKYQAVVRDNSGELLVEQSIDITLSIIDASSEGDVLYIENHTKNTNSYGVVDLVIGEGVVEQGVFSDINWGDNKKFLKLEIDVSSGLKDVGTVQLLSVPYAFYANSASNLGDKNVYSPETDTLFVVKDHDGKVVFAVYPDGAQVIVNETAKGKVGGFAVSGLSATKSLTNDYFNISGNQEADTISPSEARILWYPKKEAFLVGRVLVEHPDSVGTNSMVTGFESKAIGDWSQAFGYKSIARGTYATALGYKTLASGPQSTAMGGETTASGSHSTAMGGSTTASGDYSTAMGRLSTAKGFYAVAMGYDTNADTSWSTALGRTTTASGIYSIAAGWNSEATDDYAIAMGYYNTASGTNSVALGYSLDATGDYSASLGRNNIASGNYSTALGYSTDAIGAFSTSTGYSTAASGVASLSVGYQTMASGDYTIAMGYRAHTNGYSGSFVYADQSSIGYTLAYSKNQFVVRASGGTKFYSSSDTLSGVKLVSGAGAWSSISDKNRKENFTDVNKYEVLDKLSKINIQGWNYKSQDPSIKHIGITAQDFYNNFGFGENDVTLTWIDVAGINSVAIQELYNNYINLQSENKELKERLKRLEELILK